MPWDGTELWVARLNEDGAIERAELIAGGESESVFQPEWSPDGVLCISSLIARAGGIFTDGTKARRSPYAKWKPSSARRNGAFACRPTALNQLRESSAPLTNRATGGWQASTRERASLSRSRLRTQRYTTCASRAGQALFCGGSPTEPLAVVRLDLATGETDVLRRSSRLELTKPIYQSPQAIEFPTENDLTAHGFFYAPNNRDYVAPPDERPPLLVMSHGGPTSATTTTLKLSIQYWTSRGIAVLDVNYGGSTGYGRAYRERLNGHWGIVDVDDCVNGARYLVERGLADGDRLIIRGGSAGGYTTLAALTFRDEFKAGASYYGISDLEALEQDCHKFESRYNTNLIGPYPERQDLYKARSPIHFTERLSCPIILFQGLEDKVVPPNQSEMMYEAVQAKGIPVAYVPFEGEQHGFRKAENIKRSLDGELYFYSKVFGFEADVEPDEASSSDSRI